MSSTEEAIKKARRLLEESQRLGKASSGPCTRCRWMEDPDDLASLTGVRLYQMQCLHPIVSPVSLNVKTDELEVNGTPTNIHSARASGGLCGPEGKLYEPRYPWQYFRFWVAAAILTTILATIALVRIFG